MLGVIRSCRLPAAMGKEAMIGLEAMVTESPAPTGGVTLQGEGCAAKKFLAPGVRIEAGQQVRVLDVRGLTLYVTPLSPPDLRYLVRAEERRMLE